MDEFVARWLKRTPYVRRYMKGHLGEILQGASVVLLLRGVGAALAFGFSWLLARQCGAAGTGLYYLALTVLTLGTVLGKLGLDNPLLRYVASGAALGRWASVKGIHRKALRYALMASGSLALAVLLSAGWASRVLFHKPELEWPLRWMGLAIAPMSFLTLQAEALRGLKRIGDWMLITGVALPAFSILGLMAWGRSGGASEASLAYLIACLLTALLAHWFWARATPRLAGIRPRTQGDQLLASGRPLYLTALFETAMHWMSVLFLGLWMDESGIGIFGTALRVSSAVTLVLTAVNSIAAPKFAALHRTGRRRGLEQTAHHGTGLMVLFGGPVLALFLFWPGPIMGLFGEDFRAGASVLAILAVGQFVNVALGPVAYLLIMSGRERLILTRAVFMGCLSLGLNLALVPWYGAWGAAIATSACMVVNKLIGLFWVRRELGIWTLPFLSSRR